MDVYLTYLGCRLNESEIEELGSVFVARGHRLVEDPAAADLCVVNTCTVTRAAGRKSRQTVRRLGRLNPGARIAVTGCHATLDPNDLRLPNVTWMVNNTEKGRLVDLVAPPADTQPDLDAIARHLGPGALGRTRAFVKVQDGCDNRCTFCITTIARGPGRSRPRDKITAEVQRLAQTGYQEAILTGVHLGSYGHDLGEADGLQRLVHTLLVETDIPRLRLSSLEPWDLTPGFFDLWADARLCRQLHLPLQSGCDATLRRMARRTRSADFAALATAARERIPDLALTTDVIVGFPGETDAEFESSYRFVESMAFARLHVFAYSPRPRTLATRLPGHVPVEVKTARSRRMRHLGARLVQAHHEQFLGRTLPVLWESAKDSTSWRGLTDNYLSVTTTHAANLANRITQTRLIESTALGIRGEVIWPG